MTRRQCKLCPWKVSTDPRDIPNGYDAEKHARLRRTIAEPGVLGALRVMACHQTSVGRDLPCVGWMANQLDRGNNIALRLAVRSHRLSDDVELDGPQRVTFEETLPR